MYLFALGTELSIEQIKNDEKQSVKVFLGNIFLKAIQNICPIKPNDKILKLMDPVALYASWSISLTSVLLFNTDLGYSRANL